MNSPAYLASWEFDASQHCTYENQDGVDDYSFSHTAAYCGKPQPRRCGCAFCYPPEPEKWYVVCETCGEAFDEIGYAKAHELSCDTNTSYEVKPESEAL